MKLSDALVTLRSLNLQGVSVLSRTDLEKLFPEETKTFEKSLQRLVEAGVLKRVAKGVYLNPDGLPGLKGRALETIAAVLRRGATSYISLESALSEYGAISQVPVSHLTVMTTGSAGLIETDYGVIEFKHTKRRAAAITERVLIDPDRPLPVATPLAAWRDLKRVGRNTDMVDQAELAHAIALSAQDAQPMMIARQGSSSPDDGDTFRM